MITGAAPALPRLALARLDLGRSSLQQLAAAVATFWLAPPALDLHIEVIVLGVHLLDKFERDLYLYS